METTQKGGDSAAESETASLTEAGTTEPAMDEEVGWSRSEWMDRARRSLEQAVPCMAARLAEEAMKGSVSHMKLLLQLLGLDDGGFVFKEAGPREKTLEEILMEQWHKEP